MDSFLDRLFRRTGVAGWDLQSSEQGISERKDSKELESDLEARRVEVVNLIKMEEKRRKYSISSDNSDTTDSQTTSTSRCSKIPNTKSGWSRQKEKKPSEVFRTDLITAMKIPDSFQLSPDEYYILADPWRQEWEKGVQVPANTETIPEPVVRELGDILF
ncbi:Protein Jade-2, partial [Ophiophagus hannah]